MANALLVPSVIAKEAAFQFVNNLVFGRLVSKQFVQEFVNKIGTTVTYRRPIYYTANSGSVAQVQDTTEQSDTIVINNRYNVMLQFGTQDLTLTIEDFSERYIRPAAITLANQVDLSLAGLAKNTYNAVGTAGTTPSTVAAILEAMQILDEQAVPVNDRFLVVNPAANAALLGGLTTILQPTIVQDIIKEAAMGRVGGFDLFSNQNIQLLTAGSPGGTPVLDIAGQGAVVNGQNNLEVRGGGNGGTYNAGDIVTIAGVHAVNPLSKQSTGRLKQFVVTQNATLNSSGATDATHAVYLNPPFYLSGAYQNIDSTPADGSAITLVATNTSNLAFHKKAFTLVSVALEKPTSAVWSESVQYEDTNIRIVRDYDIINDLEFTRMDIMYGVKATYPELATRLLG